jgi:anti-anti-sigma factor
MPSLSPRPTLEIVRHPGRTLVRIPAGCTDLTGPNLDAVGDQLTRLADAARGEHVQIDLSPVDFLSSAALSRFLALHRKCQAAGGRFSLMNARPMVREVFAITRLDQIIDIGPAADRAESLSA